jgi:hypothetical protein
MANSPLLLKNYVMKYLSFKAVDQEINALNTILWTNGGEQVCINRDISALLNILTTRQFNGLIRHMFVIMKRLNSTPQHLVEIPTYNPNEGEDKLYPFISNLMNGNDYLATYFIIALYTYF